MHLGSELKHSFGECWDEFRLLGCTDLHHPLRYEQPETFSGGGIPGASLVWSHGWIVSSDILAARRSYLCPGVSIEMSKACYFHPIWLKAAGTQGDSNMLNWYNDVIDHSLQRERKKAVVGGYVQIIERDGGQGNEMTWGLGYIQRYSGRWGSQNLWSPFEE